MALGFFESSSDPSQPDGYDALQRRRKLADALMQQGMSGEPIRHWSQGLANVLKTAIGGYQSSKLDQEESKQNAEYRKMLTDALGGGMPANVTGGAPMGEQPAVPGSAPQPGGSPPSMGPVTGDKQAFIEQMMPHAMKVSQETGIDPRIVISQAALESGWGRKAPGNNYFGIKSHGAPGGQTLNTTEVVNGQPVRTADSFRQYGGMGESAAGYAEFLKKNPRYQPMLQAQGLQPQIDALAKSGYATDPQYGQKIASIAQGIPMPQGQPQQVASAGPQMALAPQGQPPAMPPGMPQGAPEQGAVPPGRQQLAQTLAQPPAAPARPQMAQPDPSRALLMQALTNPSLSPQQRQQAMSVAQMLQKDDSISTVDLGTAIGIMDKKGNIIRQIPKQKDVQHGVIGQDEYGNNKYGFIDPRTQTVNPTQMPQQPPPQGQPAPGVPAEVQIAPAPPGVNPKVWRDEQTKKLINGEKFTEAETKSSGFAERMTAANGILADTELEGTSKWNAVAGYVPGGNNLVGENAQKYEQAKRDFINAQLRQESGAVVGKEEFSSAEKQYFPQVGDSKAVIEQKRVARQRAAENMVRSAGRAYKPKVDAPKSDEGGWTEIAPGIRIREKR